MDKIEIEQHIFRILIELDVILEDDIDDDTYLALNRVKYELECSYPEMAEKLRVDREKWK